MSKETLVDSIINRIKNNKVIAIVILTGVSLIALGNLTDALTKIGSLSRHVLGLEKPAYSDLELINLQLRPVYFTLDPFIIGDGSLNPSISEGDPFGRRSKIEREGAETLKKYATLLKEISVDYTLLIEGHTSRRALTPNIQLARTRVENVLNYLYQQGIPLERMKTATFGGEKWKEEDSPDTINIAYKERVEFRLFIDKH